MFSNSYSGGANDAPELPAGFIPSFVAIPLLTYGICLAVVWTLGFSSGEREDAKQRVQDLLGKAGIYGLLYHMARLCKALYQAMLGELRKIKRATDGLISGN